MENLIQKVEQSAKYIQEKIKDMPQIGLILGSGLGDLALEIQDKVTIDYSEIPNFPVSTVEGHAGRLVVGELQGKYVIAMQGRFHYYEGYTMQELTFPVWVMKKLGIKVLIVTNACGGLNTSLYPGALMAITDHINMMGSNPLIGPNISEFGPRFPDMSNAYDKTLMGVAMNVAKSLDIDLRQGVYCAISGPYYLSKAELRMLITIGSDTVGMSTIPEVIAANHCGIRVLGISCVTDMATPDNLIPPEHEHIVEVANKTKPKFISLMKGIINEVKL